MITRRNTPSAFTLLELLIAISLIVIMLALAFPLLQKMKVRYALVRTNANLKTASAALFGYVSDHGGYLPDGAYQPKLQGPRVPYWFNALDYYAGGSSWTLEGAKSPARSQWLVDPLKPFTTVYEDARGYTVNVPYGWNHAYFGLGAGSSGWNSRLLEVAQPAQTIIIGTSKDDPNLQSQSHCLLYADERTLSTRYDGKGVYLFLDGHQELLTPKQAVEGTRFLFLKNKPDRSEAKP